MSVKNKTLSLLLTIFILIPFAILAEEGDGGQAGAFLRLPINARANGMGGAFTAVVQDPSASWWNPAGFGYVERFQVAGMYTHLSLDRTHNFVGVSLPLGGRGAIGINWLQFGVSDIDGRDIAGQPTGKFDDSEMAFGLSYAMKLASSFSIGINAKYLHHSLQDFSASGFGLDAGVMYHINEIFRLGFTMQNIFGKIKWNTESNLEETFPKVYRGGAGVQLPSLPVLAAFDVVKTTGQGGIDFFVGSEVWFLRDIFALRGGYANSEFTVGASLGWEKESFGFHLDYAYLQDVLNESPTSQLSFVLEF